jgi:ELWxxDGT repeat protein
MSLVTLFRRMPLIRYPAARSLRAALRLENLDHRILPSHSQAPFAVPGAHPQPQDNDPIVQFEGRAYFAGSNAAGTDVELWRTDGKTASQVADINPGPGSSNPANLTVVDDLLYFTANDGSKGVELYKYDGKAVSRVADINPGAGSSNPYDLTAVNDTLYFVANDGSHGSQVWRTEGTSQGTFRVTDIGSGSPGGAQAYDLTPLKDTVYFGATNNVGGTFQLYKTQGTPGTTSVIATAGSNPYDLTVFKRALYFGATEAGTGQELWKTDGTTASVVDDINPGPANSGPYELTVLKDRLYFGATDGVNGVELWKTDGTASGTQPVANLNLHGDSNPYQLTVFNGSLYFFAADGNGLGHNKLWKTNGTASNTTSLGSVSDNAFYLTAAGGSLYFTADDSGGAYQVWRTNGRKAPTQVTTFTKGTDPAFLTPFKNNLVFMTEGGSMTQLWVAKKGGDEDGDDGDKD